MALLSSLFRGNPSLQACLVNDSAHITPGAKGEHVARIQAALVRLRYLSAKFAHAEIASYGTETARAVLAYKREFGIVNHSYQSQADNIVGRMTIASLDHAIWMLDGGDGGARVPDHGSPHPRTPPNVTPALRPVPIVAKPVTAKVLAPVREASSGSFKPPLSNLPPEIQAVVRRSNAEKVPFKMLLYPYIAVHEGPLDDDELSKRFAAETSANSILLALFNRMRPFDIWKFVRIIESVYSGTGSKGMFCSPFDHTATLNHMITLTKGPVTPFNPYLAKIRVPITDSKFCRDGFNVHGERDSFREIVKQGPGLHICVTNSAGRARTDEHYPFCDFHIDEVQQGQVCVDGVCLPIINGQTIEHLRTVGPWLLDQPGEWLKKHPLKFPKI